MTDKTTSTMSFRSLLEALGYPMDRHAPRSVVYSPRDHARRHVQDFPNFAGVLARKPRIAGWSHNPWQDPESADAIATRIATRYIQHFTHALSDLGYLPFMGAEVNCGLAATISESCSPADDLITAIDNICNAIHARMEMMYPAGAALPYVRAKLSRIDTLLGKTYNDCNEFELCTPAQSPYANVLRVNAVKRILYETSHDYISHFAHSREGRADDDAEIPSSPTAEHLASQMGPYRVTFANRYQATGEHLSLSLLRRDQQYITDYSHARRHSEAFAEAGASPSNKSAFGEANLMQDEQWSQVLLDALLDYLPNDDMLAYGHKQKLHCIQIEQRQGKIKHEIRWHAENATADAGADSLETSRIEVRSYNDASSNVALTTLAILAITYATVKAIHHDPAIMKNAQTDGVPRLNLNDVDRIKATLAKRYRSRPRLAASEQVMRARFVHDSLTLQLMREFVEETVPFPAEKKRLLDEIDTFVEAVLDRPRQVTPSRHRR